MANDDLLHKADALMSRHRVFVAGATPNDPAADDVGADDVPVLTEVISADALPEPQAAAAATDMAALRGALASELETWLDQELPQHILRVLDGITDQLIIQLSQKARADLLPRLQSILDAPHQAAKPDSTND